MESASKNVGDLHMTKTNANLARSTEYVDKVTHGKHTSLGEKNQECYRCGGDHEASSCKFKETKCYTCQKKGHTAKKCRNRNKGQDKKSLRKDETKGQKSSNYFLDVSDSQKKRPRGLIRCTVLLGTKIKRSQLILTCVAHPKQWNLILGPPERY